MRSSVRSAMLKFDTLLIKSFPRDPERLAETARLADTSGSVSKSLPQRPCTIMSVLVSWQLVDTTLPRGTAGKSFMGGPKAVCRPSPQDIDDEFCGSRDVLFIPSNLSLPTAGRVVHAGSVFRGECRLPCDADS